MPSRSSHSTAWIGVGVCLLLLAILAPLTWWSSWPPKLPALGALPPPPPPPPVPPPLPPEFDVWQQASQEMPLSSAWDELLALENSPTEAATHPAVASAVAAPLAPFHPDIAALPTWEPEPETAPARLLAPARRGERHWRTGAVGSADPLATLVVESDGTLSRDHVRQVGRSWPVADSLVWSLESLCDDPLAGAWAQRLIGLLQEEEAAGELSQVATLDASRLAALERSLAEGSALQKQLKGEPLRRGAAACYALRRRLEIWRVARTLGDGSLQVALSRPASAPPSLRLTESVREVDRLLRAERAESWRSYLFLDQFAAAGNAAPEERQRLAIALTTHLDRAGLSDSQRKLLTRPEVRKLYETAWRWAADVAWTPDLLVELERFEAERDLVAARKLATATRALRWSEDPAASALALAVEKHYRNSNLRVSASKDLLERMIEQPRPTVLPFTDEVLGARVGGRNVIMTNLEVEFVPDPSRWHLNLLASGQVGSQTRSEKGPVTLYSSGRTDFVAEKTLLASPQGIVTEASASAADTSTSLQDVETNLDGVPLFGQLTRSIAVRQHDKNLPLVKRIAERKASRQINAELDAQVARRVEEAQQQFEDGLLSTLRGLGLRPTATDMQTTADRLVARARLAGVDQLAANTPRPQAPADCWASAQVHESAINNALQGLRLDGRSGPIRDVLVDIARRIGQDEWRPDEDVPENAWIELAPDHAVRIVADEDVVRLELRVVELSVGDSSWYDFGVEATYVPRIEGLKLELARPSGGVGVLGDHLGFRDQVALRSIFSKVLGRNRPLTLIGERWTEDPRFADLAVVQCVIRDGWLGAAVGPRPPVRTATRPPR